MAVDFFGIPAETFPLFAQGGELKRLVGARRRLPLVVVNDDAKILEFLC